MINIMHLTKKPIALAVTAVILVSSSMSVFAATLSAEPSEVDNATVEVSAFSNEMKGLGGATISDEA